MPPEGKPATEPPKPIRFHFVDGLRGLAAVAVLGFHLNMPAVATSLGDGVSLLLGKGWLGVQVFFVLSGFVIAHSLRRVESTVAFIGRFVLRRSLRLDPPYWATVLLALLSILGSNLLFSERRLPLPSAGAIGAHLVYLQEVLGYGQIVDVFWTLCLEFQMYLVFVTLLTVGAALKKFSSTGIHRVISVVSLGLLLIASLWSAAHRPGDQKVWFLAYWYQFFGGALTYWVATKRERAVALAPMAAGCVALALVAYPFDPAVTLATILILCIAARRRRLESWLSARPFQWFGRISYSLYLTHTVLVSRGWNGFSRLGFLEGNELFALAILAMLAILAGDLWNRAFERPALAWSRRISLLTAHRTAEIPDREAKTALGANS